MQAVRWSRVTATVVVTLAAFALGTLLVGIAIALSQPPQPPPSDEGTLAHLFQIAVGLLVPASALYVATADWTHPSHAARPLAVALALVLFAFALLFYFEKVAQRLG